MAGPSSWGTAAELRALLRQIDGSSYPAYRRVRGDWQLSERAWLTVDHVQGDPYAAPSRVRVWLRDAVAAEAVGEQVVAHLGDHAGVRVAVEDGLLRRMVRVLAGHSRRVGSGKGGGLRCHQPGPEVVRRSAVRWHPDGTAELRLEVGLPARGRRVMGREAAGLLLDVLAQVADAVRVVASEEVAALREHVACVVRQRWLRRALPEHGLVAFVADGSCLPRASGVHQGPLADAVRTKAPEPAQVVLHTPWGRMVGLGVRRGVTVVTGGGFHGKSTFLAALQSGVMDHVQGDGREHVVSDPTAVRVRAEEGRAVHRVDISPFLGSLPGGGDTTAFSTQDASGSTSQAAALVEAVAAGARTLWLDEDTSATNLLVRDPRMDVVVPAAQEPIVPLVRHLQGLVKDWGVSVVMVVGGVAEALAVADQVLVLQDFELKERTQAVRTAVSRPGWGAVPAAAPPLPELVARVPHPDGLAVQVVRARDHRAVSLDREELDLTGVEEVRDAAHARTLGLALAFVGRHVVDGRRSLPAVLSALEAILEDEGLDALSPYDTPVGGLTWPRRQEVAAAINRWRRARMVDPG